MKCCCWSPYAPALFLVVAHSRRVCGTQSSCQPWCCLPIMPACFQHLVAAAVDMVCLLSAASAVCCCLPKAGVAVGPGMPGFELISSRKLRTSVNSQWGDVSLVQVNRPATQQLLCFTTTAATYHDFMGTCQGTTAHFRMACSASHMFPGLCLVAAGSAGQPGRGAEALPCRFPYRASQRSRHSPAAH